MSEPVFARCSYVRATALARAAPSAGRGSPPASGYPLDSAGGSMSAIAIHLPVAGMTGMRVSQWLWILKMKRLHILWPPQTG